MRPAPIITIAILVGGAAPARADETQSETQSETRSEIRYEYHFDHLVLRGTDFTAAAGLAPGTQGDLHGIAMSGSTSLENLYTVDGINTTSLEYGTSGSAVPYDFVEELEIVTGGYDVDQGRATGGLVHVTTRSGSNQMRGSVFAYYTPGFLTAAAERAPSQASSIDARTDLDHALDVGAEVGGPIVRDRAWYWLGFAPQRSRSIVTRTTSRRIDRDQDGAQDVDLATGLFAHEILDEREISVGSQGYAMLARLGAAIGSSHRAGLSVRVTPTWASSVNAYGAVDQQRFATRTVTTDVAATWTSKLDDRTGLEALVGVHRASRRFGSAGGLRDDVPLQTLIGGDLGTWSELGGESDATSTGCSDGGDDPYPGIVNCPDLGPGYAIGGPGALADDVEQRLSARLSVTRRIRGHVLEAGADLEDNRLDQARLYSGDRWLERNGDRIESTRWVGLHPAGAPGTRSCSDGAMVHGCELLDADDPGSYAHHETINWAAYLHDSWVPRRDLTVNAGLRYEEQHLRDGMTIRDMWAPRLGVIHDPSGEGRAKIFGHWGRYYESIPLHLNDRSFGGGALYRQSFDAAQCGPDGTTCDEGDPSAPPGQLFVGAPAGVAPDLGGQYLDELAVGAEREIADDTVVGAWYLRRRLGRVVEDVSLDGADSYLIANPGEGAASAFDRPRRDHDALQVFVHRRFSDGLFLHASYSYARTTGNYPGLLSPDNGQIEPNVSSQFDLLELSANRDGPLPQDRPHNLKLDGYYSFDLFGDRDATIGLRVRGLSGIPISALGRHHLYGASESFLLPRGALGRTPFVTSVDLHVDYGYQLTRGVRLSVFADVFNVANHQGTSSVDDDYTYSNVNPIVGGRYQDLIWAKQQSSTGSDTAVPVRRNPDVGRTDARYAPLSARIGARLRF